MSEFYNKYNADNENTYLNKLQALKINEHFEEIKSVIEKENMDIEKLIQDLSNDIKIISSLMEYNSNLENSKDPSNILPSKNTNIPRESCI